MPPLVDWKSLSPATSIGSFYFTYYTFCLMCDLLQKYYFHSQYPSTIRTLHSPCFTLPFSQNTQFLCISYPQSIFVQLRNLGKLVLNCCELFVVIIYWFCKLFMTWEGRNRIICNKSFRINSFKEKKVRDSLFQKGTQFYPLHFSTIHYLSIS